MGGSSTADNVTPYNILNIKRLCLGIRAPEERIIRQVLCRSAEKDAKEIESIVWETLKRLPKVSMK